jgi:hypothetical protein
MVYGLVAGPLRNTGRGKIVGNNETESKLVRALGIRGPQNLGGPVRSPSPHCPLDGPAAKLDVNMESKFCRTDL